MVLQNVEWIMSDKRTTVVQVLNEDHVLLHLSVTMAADPLTQILHIETIDLDQITGESQKMDPQLDPAPKDPILLLGLEQNAKVASNSRLPAIDSGIP
jgi:hypothetical protein